MPFGMMAVARRSDGSLVPLDPANRVGDRLAADEFRQLRDGTGFWSFLKPSSLPYATVRGERRDWLVDISDGPGRLLSDRLGSPLEGYAFADEDLRSLACTFTDVPWSPVVGERYPWVTEGYYRELGAFLRVCVEHGLAISFARG